MRGESATGIDSMIESLCELSIELMTSIGNYCDASAENNLIHSGSYLHSRMMKKDIMRTRVWPENMKSPQ